jgi:hypothetical protein
MDEWCIVLIPDSMLRKWFKINSVVGDWEEVATAAPYPHCEAAQLGSTDGHNDGLEVGF